MLSNFFKFISNKYIIYPFGKNSKIIENVSNIIYEMKSESDKFNCEKINEYISKYLIYFGDFYEYMQKLQLNKSNKINFNFKIDSNGIDNFKLKYFSLSSALNVNANEGNNNENTDNSFLS